MSWIGAPVRPARLSGRVVRGCAPISSCTWTRSTSGWRARGWTALVQERTALWLMAAGARGPGPGHHPAQCRGADRRKANRRRPAVRRSVQGPAEM